VHEGERASGLGRNIDPRRTAPHDAVLAGGLELDALGQTEDVLAARQQRGVRKAPRRGTVAVAVACDIADHMAIGRAHLPGRHTEDRCRQRQQVLARLRRRPPQRHGRDLDGRTRDGGPLVGRALGMAEHHLDL